MTSAGSSTLIDLHLPPSLVGLYCGWFNPLLLQEKVFGAIAGYADSRHFIGDIVSGAIRKDRLW
jgi:hypothetical protein